MVKNFATSVLCCLWLLLAVMASSCAASTDAPDNGGNATGGATEMLLKFNIYTEDAPASRAPGVWEESPANVAERILHADDLRVLVFDQSGVLLCVSRPAALDYNRQGAGNDGFYTLSVVFANKYFDDFADDAVVPFQVMILANQKAVGADYSTYRVGEARVSDIIESFRIAPAYYPSESTGIPMFGLKSLRLTKYLMTQGIDAPTAAKIDLLRALCKIEVRDCIVNARVEPDGLKYPRVTAVELVSWVDNGYLRPASDAYASGLTAANIYRSGPVFTPMAATFTGKEYRLYCPEADVADVRFRVTAVLEPGGAPRTYETSLDEYAGDIGKELVRNHIYRFDVHALNTILDLDIIVSQWNVVVNEFELDDIVSVEPDGFLMWDYDPADFSVSTETYNSKSEEQLSILNGTNKYATGTFHLFSPKGATWKAYFIPGENGVDAFEFVDVDDNGNVTGTSVYAEGNVGERATIRIRGKGHADAYRHWAELVVEVHTVDGTILSAPLTPQMSSRFIVYRENRM